MAFASSLDQVGPFSRSVADAAELLQVIAGDDPPRFHLPQGPRCPTTPPRCSSRWQGLRVGIVRECFEADGLAPEVKASVLAAAATSWRRLGCELVEVSCPRFNDGIATYYVIAPSEASANLARYDGVKYGYRAEEAASLAEMTARSRAEGFGDEVQRRILIGTYALSAGYVDAYYKKAQQVRTLIRRDFDRAFEAVDVLLTPTSPTTAFGFGAHSRRPPGHVPGRPAHDPGQHGRPAGHQPALRLRWRAACRSACS